MKRHAWWGLGLCVSMGLSACSGSEGDESGSTDDAGIGNFRDDLDQLRDQLNQLGPQLDQLNNRTTALETPKTPGSCSAGELCIPDGIDLVKAGLQPVIKALCARETTCCNAGELNILYGVAVKTAEDCEAVFADMIDNGILYSDGIFGRSVDTIVRAAHALNDTDVLVEVDAAAVAACVTEIGGAACPGAAEPESAGCTPRPVNQDSACSIATLLKGKEREGDTCEFGAINECGEGLVCRLADSDSYNDESYYYAPGQNGICAPKASVGDRCVRHQDCDDLYCDFAAGVCKAYSLEGEPCAYIDPTFENVGPTGGGSSTSIDCAAGLSCNPLDNKCVKQDCAAGSWCNEDADCGPNLACNFKASPALEAYDGGELYIGVCTDRFADGAECYGHTNCVSGFCNEGTCEAKVASGGECYEHEQCPGNERCQSGTCVAPVAMGAACSPVGNYYSNCPADSYCWDVNGDDSAGICHAFDFGTEQFIDLPNGTYCDSDSWCTSGFCRYDSEKGDYFCGAALADGAACNPQNPYESRCAAESYCKVGATSDVGTCTRYAQPGEPCDPARYGEECHNEEGACVLVRDAFVCSAQSGTKLFCDASKPQDI